MATAANPYAGSLAGRDPLSVLQSTPFRLREMVAKLGAAGLEASLAPDKWNARKIICHLADCEIAFAYRWRQVAVQPKHAIQTFDQDLWAAQYDSLSANEALDAFCGLRQWSNTWLSKLPRDTFAKPASHPERGELTLLKLLELTAGHDLHHLNQLEQIAAQGGR